MEKRRGRYYGSCWECGHAYNVEGVEEPVVMCHPQNEMMSKYAEGCRYLVPKCEHCEITISDVKTEAAPTPPKKRAPAKPKEPEKV